MIYILIDCQNVDHIFLSFLVYGLIFRDEYAFISSFAKILVFYSILFFSDTTNHGTIGQYNFTTASEFVPRGSGDFPGDVSVDETKRVVYWTNFISSGGDYEVKKTYYNQATVQLKFYPGPLSAIRLAQGESYLYVLNPTRSELDVIDKESEEVVATYNVKPSTVSVVAAHGMLLSLFDLLLPCMRWRRQTLGSRGQNNDVITTTRRTALALTKQFCCVQMALV